MSHIRASSVQQLETVVRLCGDKQQNIDNILQNIDLSSQQHQFFYNVLLILYKKIDKLRNERDCLKKELSLNAEDRKELFQLNQFLKGKLQELTSEKQALLLGKQEEVKGYDCSFDGSSRKIFQTPPFKEVYNSAKFDENKQNLIEQFRSVSAFECSGIGKHAEHLMKKYNLTSEEFKQVISGYALEQRKLLVDSQKKIYLDNTRIIKMDEDKENACKKSAFQKVKISYMK